MEELLEVRQLDYKDLFHEMDFVLHKNRLITISGANNCGKTTLLRILSDKYEKENTIFINHIDITEYSKEEYDNLIQGVFPNHNYFHGKRVLDALCLETEPINMNQIEFLLEELKLKKEKEINKLNEKEKLKLQIACAILKAKELVIIDQIEEVLDENEIITLFQLFKKCVKKYKLSFLISIMNLNYSLYSDELMIIHLNKVVLQGNPIEVLEKDNMINKSGLEIPFMIDLSVKLKDYELIDKVELNKDSLVDSLWK